jgi:outer membrane lipoprotein SlyB
LIDPLLTKRKNENDIGTVLSIRANNKNILSVDGQGNAVFSGALSAATGDFTGTIHAKAGGDIAGWYIDGTSITKVVNIETEGNTYRRVSLGSDPKYPAFFVTASSSFEK